MFKNRIISIFIGILISAIIISAMFFRIVSTAKDLGALVPLLFLYSYAGLFIGIIIVISFFIGYRRDIAQSVERTNIFIELAGLLFGIVLSIFLIRYISSYFGGRYGLVDLPESLVSLLISLSPLISIIYLFIYSYIGVKFAKLINLLFKGEVKLGDYLVAFLVLVLTLPVALFAFYKVSTVQRQETKVKSELKLTNFREQTPVLEDDGTATKFVITADLYTPVAGKYDVFTTFDSRGGTFVTQSGEEKLGVNLTEGWQPISLVFSYYCPQKWSSTEKDQYESPARKREVRVEFRLQPQNTSFPPIYYETAKAYQDTFSPQSEFYLQCKRE